MSLDTTLSRLIRIEPLLTGDDEQDEWPVLNQKARQGHNPKLTCNGRLIFDYDHTGKPYVWWVGLVYFTPRTCFIQIIQRCEYYSMQPGGTWDHLCSYEVSTGLYDVEYLEALFDDDKEAITQIESLACKSGFGPLASCPTAWNNSSVKVHCHEQWFELGWNQNLCWQHVSIMTWKEN